MSVRAAVALSAPCWGEGNLKGSYPGGESVVLPAPCHLRSLASVRNLACAHMT